MTKPSPSSHSECTPVIPDLIYIHDKLDARENIRPSKRRNLIPGQVNFSIEAVLQAHQDVVWETVLEGDDDMSAKVVRLVPT